MPWILKKTVNYAAMPDTAAANLDAADGLFGVDADYYVAGGALRRSNGSFPNNPRVWGGRTDGVRQKVVIQSAAMPAPISGSNWENGMLLVGVCNFNPANGNKALIAGYLGYNNGPNNHFVFNGSINGYGTLVDSPYQAYTANGGNPIGQAIYVTAQVETTQSQNKDGLTAIVDGVSGYSETDWSRTGYPGVLMRGNNGSLGISQVQFFEWEDAPPAPNSPGGTVSLVSRTLTQTNLHLDIIPNASTGPYTVEWFTGLTRDFAPAAGNKVPTGQYTNSGLDLGAIHADAAAKLRFFLSGMTGSNGVTGYSPVFMTESLRPALTIPPLRADLLGGRHLIYAQFGDSLTSNGGFANQVVTRLAALGINTNNVTVVNGAQPGAALTDGSGWYPSAAPVAGNIFGTSQNLHANLITMINAALAQHPGALVFITGTLLTNDAQRYTLGTTGALVKQRYKEAFAGWASAFPEAPIVPNFLPFCTNSTVSEAAHVAEVSWLQGLKDAVSESVAGGLKVFLGDTSSYFDSLLNVSTWYDSSDLVHPNGVGRVAMGNRHFEAAAQSALAQSSVQPPPDTTPPLLSSLTLRADGLHIDLVTNEDTTGTDGLAFTVGGTARTAP